MLTLDYSKLQILLFYLLNSKPEYHYRYDTTLSTTQFNVLAYGNTLIVTGMIMSRHRISVILKLADNGLKNMFPQKIASLMW